MRTAGKPLVEAISLASIRKFTPARSPKSVKTIRKSFAGAISLCNTSKFTPGRSLMNITTAERPFAGVRALLFMEEIHPGEKPYLRKDCGKTFRRGDKLSIEVSYWGERHSAVFINLCSTKEFTVVISPMTVRTVGRPSFVVPASFSIRESTQVRNPLNVFTRLNYLTQDQKILVGEKPHEGEECRRAFCWFASLVKHERIHSGE